MTDNHNDNYNDNQFTLYFNDYSNQEIRILKIAFAQMHNTLIQDCMGTDTTCKECHYNKICSDALLLHHLLDIEDERRYLYGKLKDQSTKIFDFTSESKNTP